MQFANEAASSMLNPPFCCECKHYRPEPGQGLCCKGVHHGTRAIPVVSAPTMRLDHWWGKDSCGKEGRHWEPKQ